jgi:hypothetical protein
MLQKYEKWSKITYLQNQATSLMNTKFLRWIAAFIAATGTIYAATRTYYAATDGFAVAHIYGDPAINPTLPLHSADKEHQLLIARVLKQPFSYLGKGCQSYVFVSQDGEYVIKFIKHQRFRTKPWLNALAAIPWANTHRQLRQAHKQAKYTQLLKGWQTAYNYLSEETGVIAVHLDVTTATEPTVTLVDKLGRTHRVDLNQCEYLVQRKAELFMPTLQHLIACGADEEALLLIDRVVQLLLDTYAKGFFDGDHAIMQNTGIRDGYPIQIDVGQFYQQSGCIDLAMIHQDLFNKTYRLRLWLQERAPELNHHLESQLRTIIGEKFDTLRPHFDV